MAPGVLLDKYAHLRIDENATLSFPEYLSE
jgi:hypothetical protein